jgi:uncharacterized protein YcaQ
MVERQRKISLTPAEARRIALAAQGFSQRRTRSRSSWRRVETAIEAMGVLQLDSVNVLVRSHYLPAFSRIGEYDRADLDARGFAATRRQFFEYWAHEASLLPLRLHPLMRWRMARAERLVGIYGGLAEFARSEHNYVAAVLDEITRRGPTAASDLDDPGERRGSWWGWHKGKSALEYLFWCGRVTSASRRGFERIYDLTERVLPSAILSLPTPTEDEAIRSLVAIASRALGVATETDIRDYFRLPVVETRRAIAELVEEGVLELMSVATWRQQALLAVDAARPARVDATALLSPFDPLVWNRSRTERIFGFHYRIELYTPPAKRRYGYYVLPFLENGRLTARLDLKAERAANALNVVAAYAEPGVARERTAALLAEELRHLADWLGLGTIRIAPRGNLAGDVGNFL